MPTMMMHRDKGKERQVGDVSRHKDDQQRALHRERERVARLGQRRRLHRDGGNDFRPADRFQRKKFGAADVIHQPHPQFVDDGSDLGGRRDQNVVLRLDEEQQCDDEEPRGPETDLSFVRGLRASVDRAEN